MNILKYPPLSISGVVREVGCTKRSPGGRPARGAVKEPDVRRVQFRKEVAHCLLEFVGG